ncbi:ATP-binding protein [Neptunomonas japonica]|uniref:Adenylate kinase n=1 Tax=Neptunomonas japonica JAMM 1380 TaxID=1441457 RepID=A0A7R6PN30_9GAMM|nr:ATP-binding protein [Neptunomonas japonica]BBB31181.1 adenylate kinase [Neptunomonas japonica JAMM 1380]
MERKTIFLGGIHGVGKTTACNALTSKISIPHHSCSDLIKQLTLRLDSQTTKIVDDVEGNQTDLVKAFNLYTSESWNLLDGHFCLFNSSKQVSNVPTSTFLDLKVQAIVLLTGNPETIVDRIYQRDGIHRNLEEFEEMQRCEILRAHHVATKLNIPLLVYNTSDDIALIVTFIHSILNTDI